MSDFLSQEEVNTLLQGGYDMTKEHIARLELLEKQNEIMLKALIEITENSEDSGAIACADEAIIKVRAFE